MAESQDDLCTFFQSEVHCENLQKCLTAIMKASEDVAAALRTSLVTKEGTSNAFGDEQLSVDVIADKLISERLVKSGSVSHLASEEMPQLRESEGVKGMDGMYTVVFDPLDGSSIVDCNWAVGAIFGVWPSKKEGLVGRTGREQSASVMTVLGPRTTVFLALPGKGTHEFTLLGGSWKLTKRGCKIDAKAKIFAPANLRSAQDLPGYASLVNEWMLRRLTLRYTGGMVPDVSQLFTKGQGVFCSPASDKAKAKLRLTFECAPLALLVEEAGGMTRTMKDESVLEVKVEDMEQRVPVCMGSEEEVRNYVEKVVNAL